jgi:hypothetical protein
MNVCKPLKRALVAAALISLYSEDLQHAQIIVLARYQSVLT